MSKEVTSTIGDNGNNTFTYDDGDYVIIVVILPTKSEAGYFSGTVRSEIIPAGYDDESDKAFIASVNGVEALLLAAACAGIDISGEKWYRAIYNALNSCAENC